MRKQKNKLIVIAGPTAVGKSSLAYLLAKKINAEIISADSMQVYKGLAILTNYPPASMRQSIPHHLISLISLNKEFNVAKFVKYARGAISRILNRGKIPVVVGGSGLYINVLLDGVFKGPGQDRILRKRLENQALTFGKEYLYRKLEKLDSQTAAGVHPNNLKRIIRALEVCIKTGKKMSELKKNRKGIWAGYDVKFIGLRRDREELYRIINSRVEAMFRKGAVKEAEKALRKPLSKTAGQIIGLKEIAGYLKKEYNKNEAKRLMKRNTRHLAKRQMAWFKRDSRIKWIDIQEKNTPGDIVRRILTFT